MSAPEQKVQWRWVVVGLEGDSYMNGDYVNAVEYANTREEFINQIKNSE